MAITLDNIKYDSQGLVPAIIQDGQSKAVLMMAYMNQKSLQKTIETRETWFWSRSREELWHKGATSGNLQSVQEIRYDCDQDTLLILVKPAGPACHRQTYTCFDGLDLEGDGLTQTSADTSSYSSASGRSFGYDYEIISRVIETIAQREQEKPEGSYTTYLFEQGVDKILKKVGEEASEVIIAAKNRDPEELRNESADLLYHLLVLWREQGLGFDQVLDILKNRAASKPSS